MLSILFWCCRYCFDVVDILFDVLSILFWCCRYFFHVVYIVLMLYFLFWCCRYLFDVVYILLMVTGYVVDMYCWIMSRCTSVPNHVELIMIKSWESPSILLCQIYNSKIFLCRNTSKARKGWGSAVDFWTFQIVFIHSYFFWTKYRSSLFIYIYIYMYSYICIYIKVRGVFCGTMWVLRN